MVRYFLWRHDATAVGCSLGYMNIYRTQIIKKENKGACM